MLRESHLPSQTHSIYDVFGREGIWLGSIRVHGRVCIVRVHNDTMLTYRLTDDGVMLVEVYGYRR